MARIKGTDFKAVVDEGSEVNVIDEGLTISANVKVDPVTDAAATAAGSNPLSVVGQCSEPLTIEVEVEDVVVPVHLGHAVVVRNLGTSCLIGEPGKADNRIHTIPEKKLINFNHQGRTLALNYLSEKGRVDFEVCRVMETRTLHPGESITDVFRHQDFENRTKIEGVMTLTLKVSSSQL